MATDPSEASGTASPRSRGGRPRLADAQRRGHRRYLVSANREEAETIEALAAAAGMAPSAFLRESAVKRTITWRVNAGARRELRRIGVNLNQLTRLAHASGAVAEAGRLADCLAELHRILRDL